MKKILSDLSVKITKLKNIKYSYDKPQCQGTQIYWEKYVLVFIAAVPFFSVFISSWHLHHHRTQMQMYICGWSGIGILKCSLSTRHLNCRMLKHLHSYADPAGLLLNSNILFYCLPSWLHISATWNNQGLQCKCKNIMFLKYKYISVICTCVFLYM